MKPKRVPKKPAAAKRSARRTLVAKATARASSGRTALVAPSVARAAWTKVRRQYAGAIRYLASR